jgi:putative ABC transport system permease protein
MLGIIIGVASVIILMSIGRGAQAQILSRIEALGSNLITIRPGAVTEGGVRSAGGSASTLTIEDAQAIAQQVPYVSGVASSYSRNLQLIVGSHNTNASVNGVTTDYMQINNLNVSDGTLFSDYDYQAGTQVALIGVNVKTTLFADADPIGQQMRMGTIIVHVIGVLVSRGAGFGSPDDAVFVPLSLMQQTVAFARTAQGGTLISSISLTVSDPNQSENVISQITDLLRTRHRLAANAGDDFRIQSMEEIASTLQQTTGTLTLLLGAIAAISLLVGGIGVMNIMLVSVLERTREIGIRKALGARERDIWIQFLAEAALLTLAGGIIGVVAGWVVSYIIGRLGLMATLVSMDIVIMAVSVSVGIGLFFGFYPAWNASRLNPIEALRSE